MSASTSASVVRLEGLLGASHVLTEPARLAGYEVDGLVPLAAVLPGSAAEVAEVINFAVAERLAVIPSCGRTKLRIGMPPQRYDLALDLSRLNRVLAYDPGDLTLGVEPGIRFSELHAALAEKQQFVPLAPPFAEHASIGGILSANSSTPLRHAYGSARDYLLGLEFVTGEGAQAKSGGRVVKNVTGYDLHKLLIGALGTLGVITRVNFRTFPLPRAQTAFVAAFASAAQALEMCQAIARSALQPRLVEVADPQAARLLDPGAAWLPAGHWCVVVAAAGADALIARHGTDLARMAQEARAASFASLSDADNSALLGNIREFPKLVLEATTAATIFRLSVLPTKMVGLLAKAREIAQRNELPSLALVRASGIVFVALAPPALDEAALARLTQAAREMFEAGAGAEMDARAMLEWCPTELKRRVNIWGPPRGDLMLLQRVKQVFDPQGILSPGRFMGGI